MLGLQVFLIVLQDINGSSASIAKIKGIALIHPSNVFYSHLVYDPLFLSAEFLLIVEYGQAQK
jgi:hypothetical protein